MRLVERLPLVGLMKLALPLERSSYSKSYCCSQHVHVLLFTLGLYVYELNSRRKRLAETHSDILNRIMSLKIFSSHYLNPAISGHCGAMNA
jgi:hypothetical protein